MNVELIVTLAVLGAEIAVLVLCYVQQKRPVNPAKPRLVPYGAIMIFVALAAFVTTAHTISVITGERLAPKSKMKGQ